MVQIQTSGKTSELLELLWRNQLQGVGKDFPVKILPGKRTLVAGVSRIITCAYVSVRRAEHVAAFTVESQQANLLVASKAPTAIFLSRRFRLIGSLRLFWLLALGDLHNLCTLDDRRLSGWLRDWLHSCLSFRDTMDRLDALPNLTDGLCCPDLFLLLLALLTLPVAFATEVLGGRVAEKPATCRAQRGVGGWFLLGRSLFHGVRSFVLSGRDRQGIRPTRYN
jgi:hypothetical protein